MPHFFLENSIWVTKLILEYHWIWMVPGERASEIDDDEKRIEQKRYTQYTRNHSGMSIEYTRWREKELGKKLVNFK